MGVKPTICVACGELFELGPDKPGFANRCPSCSRPRPLDPVKTRQSRRLDSLKSLKVGIRNELMTKNEKKIAAERAGKHPFFIQNHEKSITKFEEIDKGVDLLIAQTEQSLKAE